MDWVYVWSPRYRFFHEFLYSRIKLLPGFQIQPVFVEQHRFNRVQEEGHFLAGIPVKIETIINYIDQNIGKTFFFTDIDLIVMPSFSGKDLEPYQKNDITCMKEWRDSESPNIGCLLIHCNQKTLTFFEGVKLRILRDKLADQDAFIQELTTFPGSLGFFSTENFLQSHMLRHPCPVDPYKIKIVQCIVDSKKPADIIIDKIRTMQQFIDTSNFLKFLPEDVIRQLTNRA
jgi:hypothetical protein